jgi:hypothetical protein
VKWFEDKVRESMDDFSKKYRYVLREDGFYEIEEKPQ